MGRSPEQNRRVKLNQSFGGNSRMAVVSGGLSVQTVRLALFAFKSGQTQVMLLGFRLFLI